MKAAAHVLLLLVVLALSVPGFAQAPDDRLIVSGQRIGRWTLDMTIDDFVRMNGPKNAHGVYGLVRPVMNARSQSPTWRDEVWLHVWGESGFLVGTFGQSNQQVVLIGTDNLVKTAQGIGVGSRQRDVEAAYGRPTGTTALTPTGGPRLIYDMKGLSFIMATGGTVQTATVFRPGTAEQIWKY
jgi:hypothetical protein